LKVDVSLPVDAVDISDAALAAEAAGYACAWAGETRHDPLVTLALPAASTRSIELGTGITVAFARSPMTIAVAANDLQLLSRGRLLLGLGSQVKPHITRRFSMPWSHPAPRMREFVLAIRAIWRSWSDGSPLAFTGEYYQHTLMTPFFDPGPNRFGPPRIYLAGVGSLMTEVAGEVADGFLCHGFTTVRYLREVTIPSLAQGRSRASGLTDVDISVAPFVVTGRDETELAAAAGEVRKQIAFYGSTPSYRPVLELHGWGELQAELNVLSRAGEWARMGGLIDDEVLAAFAIVAEPDQVAPAISAAYADIAGRVSMHLPYDADPVLPTILDGLRSV